MEQLLTVFVDEFAAVRAIDITLVLEVDVAKLEDAGN